MNLHKNNPTNWAEVGCVGIIALIILPFILKLLFPFLLIAAVGFALYRLFIYETQTGNISRWFETDKKQDQETQHLDYDERKALYAPKEDLLEQLQKKVDSLELENKQMRERQKEDIKNALQQHTDHINRQQKKNVLNDIFGDTPESYARSDEFEKQDYQERMKKREEDIEFREMKQDVNEQLFAQERKLHDFADEAKQDRFEIRSEMREGFAKVDSRFLKIEGEFANFRVYVGEKFSQLELHFLKEITTLKEFISNVRLELKQETADIKLQFGKEILRIDRQQMGIIDRMQKYEHQVRAFAMDMMRVKNEAERFAIRGEDLLNRANTVHQRHQASMKVASNELNMGLQKMALHNKSFANTVASAKLRLDTITEEQKLTLKDMAYERIGITMLRQEYDQRNAVEQQKMQSLIQQRQHLEQKISERLSRGREVDGLRHQLHQTQEQLSYTAHRANLMRQESNIVRKLSL